jgi:hypothetical protein
LICFGNLFSSCCCVVAFFVHSYTNVCGGSTGCRPIPVAVEHGLRRAVRPSRRTLYVLNSLLY